MGDWRQVAQRIFPELQPEVEAAESPMSLWHEIVYKFETAYETPRDEDFIRRVYEYADWCLQQEGGEDAREHLPTCVVTCFWEHIPTVKAAREDMPRWFPLEEVIAIQHFFKYLLTDDEFEEVKNLYAR